MWRSSRSFAGAALVAAAAAAHAPAQEPFSWQEHTSERLSFLAPTGAGWTLEAEPGALSFGKTELTSAGSPRRHQYLRVIPNRFDAERAAWGERKIADDFRDLEERGMREMGVETGMYRLLSLVRGEETRSGRTLFTMKMVMRGGRSQGWALQRQELYLLFPRDYAATREFYILLLGDFCIPKRCKESDLSVAEMSPVLDQLKLRDVAADAELLEPTPAPSSPEESPRDSRRP